MNKPASKKSTTARRRPAAVPSGRSKTLPGLRIGKDLALRTVAKDVRAWTDFVLGLATGAADLAFKRAPAPSATKPALDATRQAGDLFKELRSAAGLSLRDLSKSIDLRDQSLLAAVEDGRSGLPFEIILRLASVLGRNDPSTVAMQLTRAYNPELWKSLDALGVGKLLIQGAREREFANIYRASDEGRDLTDDEFAAALEFLKSGYAAVLAVRRRVGPAA
jgi:transcriptional regulator with XRE-family HTH domain